MATNTRSGPPSTDLSPQQRPGGRDTCPGCWRDRVTVVGLDLGEGDQVELHACDFCERKRWMRNGQEVPMGEVLDTLLRTGGRRPKPTRRQKTRA